MLSNFGRDCNLDRTGRTIEQDVVQECRFSNWSTDCKTKDIYVTYGRDSDTWKLTKGMEVDPSADEKIAFLVKECLLTTSRLTKKK